MIRQYSQGLEPWCVELGWNEFFLSSSDTYLMGLTLVRRVPLFFVALGIVSASRPAQAQIKPRFVVIFDTSGSMVRRTQDELSMRGDGSQRHPGCDYDNNGLYDDSRIYQAKRALSDTVAAFGGAEFALARYKSTDGGQVCNQDSDCTGLSTSPAGTWACVDSPWIPLTTKYCTFQVPNYNNYYGYRECNANGTFPSNSRCFQQTCNPATDPFCSAACADTSDLFVAGLRCDNRTCVYPACKGSDVVVPFPSNGGSNYDDLLSWMDGVETFPVGTNKELRGDGYTPIGSSIDAVREWLTTAGSSVGAGSGATTTDAQVSCRDYNVILLTDGEETCGSNGANAAEILYHPCTNGGVWDSSQNRCEINGSTVGTAQGGKRVKTYVIAFAVSNATSLDAVAVEGGTGVALRATNRAELTARLGDIIASSIPVPRCDCDSTCDNESSAFPQKGQMCTVGVGRCKRIGTFHCNGAGDGVECRVTGSGSMMGLCGGSIQNPGTGVLEICGNAGSCAPGLTPEECADDDCDGEIDEGLSCSCVPEICDNLDNDCNGTIDDVPSVTCGLDVGECSAGTTACISNGMGGKVTQCQGGLGPSSEVCDGKDNDCDGVTDGFGRSCYPLATSGCAQNGNAWTCQGICQTGLQICAVNGGTNNMFGACGGSITPRSEVPCDSLDNDCDGQTDEGFGIGNNCGPGVSGVGECTPGVFACSAGAVICQGGKGPENEQCDSLDNDCDGMTDETGGQCGSTLGVCQAGTYRCQGTTLICDQPSGPRAETCNSADDDCDGTIDNNLVESDLASPTACSSVVGICRPGIWSCVSGTKICLGGLTSQSEVCNNLDDDCDGCVDCDPACLAGLGKTCPIAGAGQMCGISVGECRPGSLLCVGGSIDCFGGRVPQSESCDGKDNDCNGFTDENDPNLGTMCYPLNTAGCNAASGVCVGECKVGASICEANNLGGASLGCVSPVTPKAESCDAKDNDCDGQTDEDFDVGVMCDNGAPNAACLVTGTKICNGLGNGTTCSVPPPQLRPEVCDGQDNDCDGMADNAPVMGAGDLCGSNVGECRTGLTQCVNAKLECSGNTPTIEICDGKDNDCDGEVDDGLTPPAESCPPIDLVSGSPVQGECRPGKFVCTRNGWICRNSVGPQPEICDGKDNDCDGTADTPVECPGGSMCEQGECVPRCQDSEFPCPADRLCKNGFCVKSKCVNVDCQPGFYCNEDGTCRDRCEGVTCATGASCVDGSCADCTSLGCGDGKICHNSACIINPCATVICEAGQFCREGGCIKSCSSVSCETGQRCRDGQCVSDVCATKTCQNGQYCSSATGECTTSQCPIIACMPGFVCVEATTAGPACIPDPCNLIRCQVAEVCKLSPDGHAQCVLDGSTNAPVAKKVFIQASGGAPIDCSCAIGEGHRPETDTRGLGLVVLLGWGVLWRKRRGVCQNGDSSRGGKR